MRTITFVPFSQVNAEELMAVINEDSLRTHLIDHPYFDESSTQDWIKSKIATDAVEGCRVRVVFIDGMLAGWCGIQPDSNGFELAIVISKKFWGYGVHIFKTLMLWAKERGERWLKFIFGQYARLPENENWAAL